MNGKKSTYMSKTKAAIHEEILQKWIEHLKNLFEKLSEVSDKPTRKLLIAS